MRVFKEIILSNLVEPKFKKSELDNMSYDKLRDYAVSVINFSLGGESSDLSINKKISNYENSVFKISDNVQILLDNKINYFKINEILRLRRHSERSEESQKISPQNGNFSFLIKKFSYVKVLRKKFYYQSLHKFSELILIKTEYI